MSIQKINEYYKKVENTKRFSGTDKETSIRRHFAELLSFYAEKKNLILVDEFPIKGTRKIADGGLIDKNRFVFGYVESKDTADDLEKEIQHKIKISYPTFNILFENAQTAVLFQNDEREECTIADAKALDKLLTKFVQYESPEARTFREALTQFAKDVPDIITILQKMIAEMLQNKAENQAFVTKRQSFFELCQVCINPNIQYADIDEMIIQHILTEDIFRNVFTDAQFHEENNIAQALIAIEKTFFVGDFKRNITYKMKGYYEVIKEHANSLNSYKEKQNFLKNLYEEFYKAYNPKNADKLGIVYTPSEVVNFMLKAVDFLLEKHFDKSLIDKNVHILDPATGTGTFITDLLDYLPHNNKEKFVYKYKHEIHANEVAILPYYIAYLNIEYTFYQKMQTAMSFDNLCWVDTLDNVEVLKYVGKQVGIFGNLAENTQRIKTQNEQKISVIIGNPPYNANQQNENDNNKNREYKDIDKRIKATFIKESTAQKSKVYDMYARFYRWAMDRIDKNGIIAFITNRSFIDSKTFDGFRKIVAQEFEEIYIVDLKGDIRQNNYAEQGGNIFDIMTGVGIAFFIKNDKQKNEKAKIFYYNIGNDISGQEKLETLQVLEFPQIPFERVRPDAKGNWINQSESDFDRLIPVCNKEGKLGREGENTIFELYSLGVVTSRDEWSYDFDKKQLEAKAKFFIDFFHREKERWRASDKSQKTNNFVDRTIKWTSELEAQLVNFTNLEEELAYLQSLPPNGKREKIKKVKESLQKYLNFKYNRKNIVTSLYRPFVKKYFYFDRIYTHRIYQNSKIFGFRNQFENKVICFSVSQRLKELATLATNSITSLALFVEPVQCLPLYRYENGERVENITDWALDLFRQTYKVSKNLIGLEQTSTLQKFRTFGELEKIDIFHYVYAVLHSPAYRKKYAIDLKRDFPRIPLYPDFWHYAEAGRKLTELHLYYETLDFDSETLQKFQTFVKLIQVNRKPLEMLLPKRKNASEAEDKQLLQKIRPEIKLRVKEGIIEIDELTSISNIPAEVWEYKLGNRTAVEWVLDQYKPYKSSDETIQTKFNNYDFFEYKEDVITLLLQVIYVSVETIKIMKTL